MKVPFRQQISEFDCVPTTIINGLSYLFHRSEIPPFVVHRVYKECLDIESHRGTSSRAVQELGFLLSNYQEKRYRKFAVAAEYLQGDQVHFKRKSKIIRCLNAKGAALLCVHTAKGNWHYILALRLEDDWLHCHDPFPPTKQFINNDAVRIIQKCGQQEANLIIRMDWLKKNFEDAQDLAGRKYILGNMEDRECLLLNRIQI